MMASGPSGTGWSTLVDNLNAYFSDTNKRNKFADQFKAKHGKKGEGETGTNKRPYKFGQFVDQFQDTDTSAVPLLPSDNQRAQFLIDAGMRHWDPTSLDLLEHAIKRSLTHEKAGTAAPKQIMFNRPTTDNSATLAKAVIRITSGPTSPLTSKEAIDQAIDTDGTTLTIDIVCPPSNLRPSP